MKYIKLFENYFEDEEWNRLSPLFLKTQNEVEDLFWFELNKDPIDVSFIRDLFETELINVQHFTDRMGFSPLSSRQIYHQDLVELVELFDANGVDIVNATNYDKDIPSPMHLACGWNSKKIVKYLLNKVNLNILSQERQTPLIIACESDNDEIAELLINNKSVDLDIEDRYGRTALVHAIKNENKELIILLIVNGADTEIDMPREYINVIKYCFIEFMKKQTIDIDFMKFLLSVRELSFTPVEISFIQDDELREYMFSKEGMSKYKLRGKLINIEDKKEISKYFTYVKYDGKYKIFHWNGESIKERNDVEDNYIYVNLTTQETMFSSERMFLALSFDYNYIIYNESNDMVQMINFDVEKTFDDSRENLIKMIANDTLDSYDDGNYAMIEEIYFNKIKKDDFIQQMLSKDITYDEAMDSYDLTIKDYSDLSVLFSDDEQTVKRAIDFDLFYDSYYSPDFSTIFSELTKEMEEVLEKVIAQEDTEYDDYSSLEKYINQSDDEIANNIKDCIERAYSSAYESSYEGTLHNACMKEAYEFLTSKDTYKDIYQDNKIKGIRENLIIISLFNYGQTFLDRISGLDLYEDYPSIDWERVEYGIDIDESTFEDCFFETLSEDDVLEYHSEIYNEYKAKKKAK